MDSSKSSSTEPVSDKTVDSSRANKRILIPLGIVVVLIGAALWFFSQEKSSLPNASYEPDPMAQDRAQIENFAVGAVDSGSKFELSAHAGKVILITFWTADCTTCLLEFPAFSELQSRYKGEGLEVLAVNLDDETVGSKAVKDLWARGKYRFTSYLDPKREAAKIFQAETLPSTFVIDRQGRLAFNSYGTNDWLAPETAQLIEDLLLEDQ
jgi:thiol-disulfide isomerase/thioredoxin